MPIFANNIYVMDLKVIVYLNIDRLSYYEFK